MPTYIGSETFDPLQPHFYVRRNSALALNSTGTRWLFNSLGANYGVTFNTSAGTVTLGEEGFWTFKACLPVSSSGGRGGLLNRVLAGGTATIINKQEFPNSPYWSWINLPWAGYCNVGDVISIDLFGIGATGTFEHGAGTGETYGWWSGYKNGQAG